MTGPPWTVVEPSGSVTEQLEQAASHPLVPARREVWLHRVDAPTLVLGSAQPARDVDHAALDRFGVRLARRRSGGGAVLLEPGTSVWVDLVVPAGDPLWLADVGHSFDWLGWVWLRALGDVGVSARLASAQPADRLARLACFAGVGHGEVLVTAGTGPMITAGTGPMITAGTGAAMKVVGLSQRRTRTEARYSGVAVLDAVPDRLTRLLAVDDDTAAALIERLTRPSTPALTRVQPDDLRAALIVRLP